MLDPDAGTISVRRVRYDASPALAKTRKAGLAPRLSRLPEPVRKPLRRIYRDADTFRLDALVGGMEFAYNVTFGIGVFILRRHCFSDISIRWRPASSRLARRSGPMVIQFIGVWALARWILCPAEPAMKS